MMAAISRMMRVTSCRASHTSCRNVLAFLGGMKFRPNALWRFSKSKGFPDRPAHTDKGTHSASGSKKVEHSVVFRLIWEKKQKKNTTTGWVKVTVCWNGGRFPSEVIFTLNLLLHRTLQSLPLRRFFFLMWGQTYPNIIRSSHSNSGTSTDTRSSLKYYSFKWTFKCRIELDCRVAVYVPLTGFNEGRSLKASSIKDDQSRKRLWNIFM